MNDAILKAQLHGEKTVSKIVLKLLPLIPKHFKAFQGKRVMLASGDNSAPFKKLVKAFQVEAQQVCNAPTLRIYIHASAYSVTVELDINERNPLSDYGCNYFKRSLYVAKIENDNLLYNFDADEYARACKAVLAVTASKIKAIKKEVAALEQSLDSVKNSVPYAFRDLIT